MAVDPNQKNNIQRVQGDRGNAGATANPSGVAGVQRVGSSYSKVPGEDLVTKTLRGKLTGGDIGAAASNVATNVASAVSPVASDIAAKLPDATSTYSSLREQGAGIVPSAISQAKENVGTSLGALASVAKPVYNELFNPIPAMVSTGTTPTPAPVISPTTLTTPTPEKPIPKALGEIGIEPPSPVTTFGTVGQPQSASISFADKRTLSPEQKSQLDQVITRNASPEFQARMAEQANIVNQRVALGQAKEAAAAPSRQEVVQGQLEQAIASNQPTRVAYLRDLLKQTGDEATKRAALEQTASIEDVRRQMEARKQLGAESEESTKTAIAQRTKATDAIMEADKTGMATPMTKNALWKLYNPAPHDISSLKLIHQNDPAFQSALESRDPQKLSDVLASAGHTREDVLNALRTSGFQ